MARRPRREAEDAAQSGPPVTTHALTHSLIYALPVVAVRRRGRLPGSPRAAPTPRQGPRSGGRPLGRTRDRSTGGRPSFLPPHFSGQSDSGTGRLPRADAHSGRRSLGQTFTRPGPGDVPSGAVGPGGPTRGKGRPQSLPRRHEAPSSLSPPLPFRPADAGSSVRGPEGGTFGRSKPIYFQRLRTGEHHPC